MAWTTTGTVSVTNNNAIVYGAGTSWASSNLVRGGDIFKAPDGKDYQVLSVQSNTQLTLATAYLGMTASAQSYALIHTGLLPAELAVDVSALQSKYLVTIAQLYEWETSTDATVPLTNPATNVTTDVKPIAGLIGDIEAKAPKASPTFTGPITLPQIVNVTQPYGEFQVNGVPAFRFGSDTSGQIGEFNNRFDNGGMEVSQLYGSAPISLFPGIWTDYIDRWLVKVNAETTVTRSAVGSYDDPSFLATAFNGAAGLTSCFIGQRISAINSHDLAGGAVTVSALVYQDTGADLTAYCKIDRANSLDNFSSTTESVSLAPVAVHSGAWTLVSFTGTLSSLDVTGLFAYIYFTGAIPAGKMLHVSKLKIERGSIATRFVGQDYSQNLARCKYYYRVLFPAANSLFIDGYSAIASGYITSCIAATMRAAPTASLTLTGSTNLSTIEYSTSIDGVSILLRSTAVGRVYAQGNNLILSARL